MIKFSNQSDRKRPIFGRFGSRKKSNSHRGFLRSLPKESILVAAPARSKRWIWRAAFKRIMEQAGKSSCFQTFKAQRVFDGFESFKFSFKAERLKYFLIFLALLLALQYGQKDLIKSRGISQHGMIHKGISSLAGITKIDLKFTELSF